MNWRKRQISRAQVREFSSRYGVDALAAAVFIRRGIERPERIKYYLEDDERYLHNPFLFDEMEDAVHRILQAASEGEKVLVFGDSDVDGVTSTVLMIDALRRLGIEAEWRVPLEEDPYGLTRDLIDRCLADDVTLIIAVDCGTNDVEQIRHASEQGIDTIVIDHHNPQEILPPTVALINPKVPDSSYPFDGLCACALVAKLRFALAFAQTQLFGQPVCLLNVRPGNESLVLDAVKLENMVEVGRISESLVPGILDVEHSRLASFLAGVQILVYDRAAQERYLRQAFGNSVEVGIVDVAEELWKAFPSLAGKSLLRLQATSRITRYAGTPPGEIDVFLSLFTTYMARVQQKVGGDLVSCLDLVALGTLADMMPLEDENRILVKRGLESMSREPRAGLRSLLERLRLLGRPIGSLDVGWSLSPVLNAAGRMGEPDRAVRLFLAADGPERDRMADELIELNSRRRRVGEQARQLVEQPARESLDTHEGRFVLVCHPDIHRGVTGIVAGRLARQYGAPSAVVSTNGERAVGSIRTARGVVATELLARCDDLLSAWGGHDAAGGFQLEARRLPELEERLLAVIRDYPMEAATEAEVEVDAELRQDELSPALFSLVDLFAPYGLGNPPLVFLVRDARVYDVQLIGRDQTHLRITLETGSTKWPSVYWGAAAKVGAEFVKGDCVDALFNLEMNHFNGSSTPRLTIVDLRREAGR